MWTQWATSNGIVNWKLQVPDIEHNHDFLVVAHHDRLMACIYLWCFLMVFDGKKKTWKLIVTKQKVSSCGWENGACRTLEDNWTEIPITYFIGVINFISLVFLLKIFTIQEFPHPHGVLFRQPWDKQCWTTCFDVDQAITSRFSYTEQIVEKWFLKWIKIS